MQCAQFSDSRPAGSTKNFKRGPTLQKVQKPKSGKNICPLPKKIVPVKTFPTTKTCILLFSTVAQCCIARAVCVCVCVCVCLCVCVSVFVCVCDTSSDQIAASTLCTESCFLFNWKAKLCRHCCKLFGLGAKRESQQKLPGRNLHKCKTLIPISFGIWSPRRYLCPFAPAWFQLLVLKNLTPKLSSIYNIHCIVYKHTLYTYQIISNKK